MSTAGSSSVASKRKTPPLRADVTSNSTESTVTDAVASRLDAAYTRIDGYALARERRKKMRSEGNYEGTESLQYGEIDVAAFYKLLCELPLNNTETDGQQKSLNFLDIGSGTGKPVFTAALFPSFAHCSGIEIVQDLHDAALRAQANLSQNTGTGNDELVKDVKTRDDVKDLNALAPVEFYCNDSFSDSDEIVNLWKKADVVFAPTTCFTDEMMVALCERINKDVQPGSIIVTNTRSLPDEVDARVLFRRRLKYGRGALDFIVHRLAETSIDAEVVGNEDNEDDEDQEDIKPNDEKRRAI